MEQNGKKIRICLLCALVIVGFMIPCQVRAATKLNVSKKTMYINDTYQLKLKGATGKVSWKSSEPKIVVVNSKGKITAKKAGVARITAKYNKKAYQCNVKVKKLDFTGDYKEMGKGKFSISTYTGTSEGGEIPVIVNDQNLKEDSIGIALKKFDKSKWTYFYVDGRYVMKKHIGTYHGDIKISGATFQIGVHKIEVVQYSNDKPSGKVITYKMAQYEIMEGF